MINQTDCYKSILPYSIEKGAFERINNIETVKSIVLVCQTWKSWIYSNEGPFIQLDQKKIEEVISKPPRCGILNKLNNILMNEVGRRWFRIVDQYEGQDLSYLFEQKGINYSINNKNSHNETPLQLAVERAIHDKKYIPLIRVMLDLGAQPLHLLTGIEGIYYSFFYYFFSSSHTPSNLEVLNEIYSLLEEKGFSINAIDIGGFGFLHYYNNYFDSTGTILKWYQEKGGDINLISRWNDTPFQIMITYCHYKEAMRLLENGANINQINENGDYPLHQIIENLKICNKNEKLALVDLILKKHPNQFFTMNAKGHIPLWCAIKEGSTDVQKRLIKYVRKNDIQFSAENKKSLMDAFLKYINHSYIGKWFSYNESSKSFDLNEIDCRDLAYCHRYIKHFDLLIEFVSNAQDHSILFASLYKGGNSFFQELASICPFLIEALIIQNHDIFKGKFGNNGESIAKAQQKGLNTVFLVKACVGGNLDAVKALLEGPVYLLIQDNKQHTLLHLMACCCIFDNSHSKSNFFKIARLLLIKGLNPNIRDKYGKTALGYINKDLYPKWAILLEDSGGIV